MIDGLTTPEIADYVDALIRRGKAFAKIPPVHPPLPWSTLSGFADSTVFFDTLSRTWPVFPVTGDLIYFQKLFPWVKSAFINPNFCKAICYDELSIQ